MEVGDECCFFFVGRHLIGHTIFLGVDLVDFRFFNPFSFFFSFRFLNPRGFRPTFSYPSRHLTEGNSTSPFSCMDFVSLRKKTQQLCRCLRGSRDPRWWAVDGYVVNFGEDVDPGS